MQSQSKARSDASIRRDWSGARRLLHAIWPKSSVVKGIWAGPAAQQIQSKATVERQERTSIDGFGRARHQSYSGQQLHLCARREGQPTRMSQPTPPEPASLPRRGSTPSPLCHSLTSAGRPCIQPCHFNFLGRERRQKCAQHMVEITYYSSLNFRDILSLSFLSLALPLFLFHKLLQDW